MAGTLEVGRREKSPAGTVWHWKTKRAKQEVQLFSNLLYKTHCNLRVGFFHYLSDFVTI